MQSTTTTREKPRSDQENKELTNLALRGLQLLSAWTQQVMELVSVMLCLRKRCLDIVCWDPTGHGSGQCHAVSEETLFWCCLLKAASSWNGQCHAVSQEKFFV